VLHVTIREEDNTASVVVPDRQLSLAIGKEGQNARLAAKLTGWRIDIKPESAVEVTAAVPAAATPERAPTKAKQAEAAPVESPIQPWQEVIEAAEEEAVPQEEPQPATVSVQEAPTKPTIRFAEDLLPSLRTDVKRKKKGERVVKEPEGKPKKAKKGRRPAFEAEEDLELLEEDLKI
jgi:N utilization substance protein A